MCELTLVEGASRFLCLFGVCCLTAYNNKWFHLVQGQKTNIQKYIYLRDLLHYRFCFFFHSFLQQVYVGFAVDLTFYRACLLVKFLEEGFFITLYLTAVRKKFVFLLLFVIVLVWGDASAAALCLYECILRAFVCFVFFFQREEKVRTMENYKWCTISFVLFTCLLVHYDTCVCVMLFCLLFVSVSVAWYSRFDQQ